MSVWNNQFISKLGRRCHDVWLAYPLACLIFSFALGILIGGLFLPAKEIYIILFLAAFVLLAVALWRKHYVCLLFVACFVGCLWFGFGYYNYDDFKLEPGTQVSIEGRILETTGQTAEKCSFILEPAASYHWPGNVMVYAKAGEYTYGQRVAITGIIAKDTGLRNPGGFDYNAYLRRQGIFTSVYTTYQGSVTIIEPASGNPLRLAAAALKTRVIRALDNITPEQKGFAVGILFGDKSGISGSDKTILSQTGIMHVFAVSGLHVGFVLALGMGLAKLLRLKKWLFAMVAFIPILLYAAMADFTPSVTRALVMATVGLLAYVLGREREKWTSLAVAAGVCLLWRPYFLFDVGFQLSFLAVAGIFYLSPCLEKVLPGKGALRNSFALTLAAQLAIMPIVAWNFHVVTLLGMLISPLLIFVAGVVVVGGLATLLLSYSFIGPYFVGLLGRFLQGGVQIATWMNAVPFAWRQVHVPHIGFIFCYYGLLLILPWLTYCKKPRWRVSLAILFLFALLVVPTHWRNDLRLTYLDVGQGTAIVVETPGGNSILIDGGGSGGELTATGTYVILPYLASQGIQKVDYIFNTHPHGDHMGGLLPVLETLPVGCLFTGVGFDDIALQEELLNTAAAAHVPWDFLLPGDILYLEENLTLEVLSAPLSADDIGNDLNDASCIFRLRYGDIDFLLPGDAGQKPLSQIPIREPETIEVIEMAHHGSPNSFTPDLYRSYQPEAVIISVGENNSYGHPDPAILAYWQKRGIPVYRTDELGAITCTTDGNHLTVEGFLP